MSVVGETAISSLINIRSQALRISRSELATRCGFKNIAKGVRRLDHVCGGDFSHAGFLLSHLPDALSFEPCVVEAAIVATRQAKQREEDQSYRDGFRPHAIIFCERTTPEPLFVAAVIGIDRILRIDFAEGSAPVTYVKQALMGVSQKLARWNSSSLPAFGRPTGFVINYSYDRAIEFDFIGKPLRIFDEAITVGRCNLAISGRAITPSEIDRLIGR